MTTPYLGPWTIQPCADDHGETTVICDAEGFTVAKIPSAVWDESAALQFPQDAANARLIRGAPDCLAVLRDLISCDVPCDLNEGGECRHCGRDNSGYEDQPCDDECPGQIARALIAQIEGATPTDSERTTNHD